MSQRKYQVGRFEVMTGWDRPLGYFFLSVFDFSVPDDVDEGYIRYSTLDDPRHAAHEQDVDFILERLEELRLPAPVELRADLLEDQARDAGNLIHIYPPMNHEP